jgi:mannosyltransferase
MAYSALFYVMKSLGTQSEWMYRLPSLLAVGAAAFALFRMTCRMFGRDAAWMATAAFVSFDTVRFAADDARPYAIALFFAVLASDLLLRFLDKPGYGMAVSYGLASAAMLHFQILFGALLVAHGAFAVYRMARGEAVRAPHWFAALAALGAGALPLALQYLKFTASAGAHSFAAAPSRTEWAISFMPATWVCVAMLVAAACLVGRGVAIEVRGEREAGMFALLWALTPPIVLFGISVFTPARVFVPRYLLSYSPGMAMCFGAIAGSLKPRVIRAAAMCVMALLAVVSMGAPTSFRHTVGLGDWGAAIRFIDANAARDGATVLIRSQYVESDAMPLEPPIDNGNFSQVAFYPLRAASIPLANRFTPKEAARVDAFLRSEAVRRTGRFLVAMFHGPAPEEPLLYFIRGRLGLNCVIRELANFDGISVTEFVLGGQVPVGRCP